MAQPNDIVGSGWSYPLRVDRRGGIALTAQPEEEIEQAINIVMRTPPGQRLMRPAFGCRIHELQFSSINAGTTATAVRHVEEAIRYWEPRIELTDVLAIQDPRAPGRLLITVIYRLKATHDERALVYPFYTIPDEG